MRLQLALRLLPLITSILSYGLLAEPSWSDSMPLPTLTGRVVDKAEILSDATEADLTAKIMAHEQATGDQVVIVTLPDLMRQPIEDWGLTLGRSWGIGQKGKDNGVIFLIAPNDRELRIEVGYGLEGDLPDAIANDIIQSEVIPHFKQGDMDGGVISGLDAILAALGGKYQPTARPLITAGASNYENIIDTLVPFAFVAVFMLVGFLMSLRRRWDKKLNRYVWYVAASSGSSLGSSSFRSSSGRGFSGGGGSFGGGGASGKW